MQAMTSALLSKTIRAAVPSAVCFATRSSKSIMTLSQTLYNTEVKKRQTIDIRIHWRQIKRQTIDIGIHWRQIKRQTIDISIHWRRIKCQTIDIGIHWRRIKRQTIDIGIHWRRIKRQTIDIGIHWRWIKRRTIQAADSSVKTFDIGISIRQTMFICHVQTVPTITGGPFCVIY